ncbi:hypothetical protein KW497_01530 [Vibrio fluvialis]|nr:hypothetical protein [Vibrio fluvialis]MBY8122666.1 hypothetical protein [Vibrio fluvialis]
MFKLQKSIFDGFNNEINGSYGKFETPSGRVNYIQVTARITAKGVSLSDELAGKLVPVREILDTKEMNFGQLLQRDLDDHRVSTKLVPYILKGSDIGPAYFPPIQAMLLPFNVGDDNLKPQPIDSFGEMIDVPVSQDQFGLYWKGYQCGESYRFEKMSYPDGSDAPFREGKLRWHNKRAKLVVIDGQHRAMAMLAIYRTLHKAWKGTGSQYRHFYEHEITELLKENEMAQEMLKNGIEYPVTITWFDNGTAHHESARKLFVDVNKNAKPPTESRLILLGDNELKDIYSRSILNSLRERSGGLPIYAVEYDYGNSNSTQTGKWSALVNIEMLRSMVVLALWGTNKNIKKLNEKVGVGRSNIAEMDSRFRRQLQVGSWFPEKFIAKNGEIYSRDMLGNTNFPREKVEEFEKRFNEGWGSAIINILSNFLPYRSHYETLNSMSKSWADADNEATLAREAIFEGVGLFWTLREANEHWDNNKSGNIIPDTVKAWSYIKRKESEFYLARCKKYTGSSDKLTQIQDMYSKTNTYACFMGLVGALASIAEELKVESKDLSDLSIRFIESLNLWLEDKPSRKYFLVSQSKLQNTFNLLPKLDQPMWIYFRYFWFEVLNHGYEAGETSLNEKEYNYVNENIESMRWFYYESIIRPEQRKAIEKISDNEGEALDNEVEASACKKYDKILKAWFDAKWS